MWKNYIQLPKIFVYSTSTKGFFISIFPPHCYTYTILLPLFLSFVMPTGFIIPTTTTTSIHSLLSLHYKTATDENFVSNWRAVPFFNKFSWFCFLFHIFCHNFTFFFFWLFFYYEYLFFFCHETIYFFSGGKGS